MRALPGWLPHDDPRFRFLLRALPGWRHGAMSAPASARARATPGALWTCLAGNRALIASLVRRDIGGRYRGSALGISWSVLTPILMLAVYTFVFSEVFPQRIAGRAGTKAEFALVLFAGLLVFNMFAECVTRAPSLIVGNANYVKRVVFPLEVLPVVTLLSALFHMVLSVAVWLLFYAVTVGVPQATLLWLPVALVPVMLVTLGITWLLAALGVYVRDVAQLVGVLVMVLMFLSPIFYQVDALQPGLRWVLYLSPLTVSVEFVRDALYWGRAPGLVPLIVSTALFTVIAWCGFAFFQKTRRGFADVL